MSKPIRTRSCSEGTLERDDSLVLEDEASVLCTFQEAFIHSSACMDDRLRGWLTAAWKHSARVTIAGFNFPRTDRYAFDVPGLARGA